jgi:hypothetical protein
MSFAKVVLLEIVILKLTDSSFEFYDTAKLGQSLKDLLIDLSLGISSFIAFAVYYYLAKRSVMLSNCFNAVETLLTTIILMEKSLLHEDSEDVELSLPRHVIQIATISLLGANQPMLILSYVLSWIYIVVRSHSVVELYMWIRISAYFIVIFAISFILARVYTQMQREAFRQKLQMKQMSQLFLSLVRVFHDGIIISHNEDIIFKNKQVNRTFDLDPQVARAKAESPPDTSEAGVESHENLVAVLQGLEPEISTEEQSHVEELNIGDQP